MCTLTNHMNLEAHFNFEDLWSPKMCLFPLQIITPPQLAAVADTHTEHNQMPHVHVNSHTCRSTVLSYTVVPQYTRRLMLKRVHGVDKKNQLDVSFCVLYFSSNSCSTCFGQPCAHHQDLTTSLCYILVLVCAVTICGVTQTCLTVSGLCVDMRVFWCWFRCCM